MKILQGHVLNRLREMESESIQCCVTSPPYWGLRDYKSELQIWGGESSCKHEWNLKRVATEVGKGNWAQGTNGRGELQSGGVGAKREPIRSEVQIGFCKCGAWLGSFGLEPTPELYVEHAVEIFRGVRQTLRDDGTLWLNVGDSYASSSTYNTTNSLHTDNGWKQDAAKRPNAGIPNRCKPKDLIGIPWMLAFALRADGWYLRQDIIWAKPNPMPESVTDRCTKSHEYLFLLSKSAKYYFDNDAIKEPCASSSLVRWDQDIGNQEGSYRVPGKTNGTMKAVGGPTSWKGSEFHTGKTAEHQLGRASKNRSHKGVTEYEASITEEHRTKAGLLKISDIAYPMRNKRDVWTVATQPFKEAHFATFPPKLIEPCILAGCPVGGVVLDPFTGSGTTGVVALRQQRDFIGIELSAEYVAIANNRLLAEILK